MSILAFAGEMAGFVPGDSTVIEDSTSGLFDPAFARCAVKCITHSDEARVAWDTPQTELWFQFEIYGGHTTGTNSIDPFFVVYDSGTTPVFVIGREPSTDELSAAYWNGSAFVTAGTNTTVLVTSFLQRFDVHITCNSASGVFDVYVAGTKRIASGTIDLSGIASMGRLVLCGWGASWGVNTPNWFSQVGVATESTIGKKIGIVVPSGNSATNTAWSGDYTAVNEIAYSDGDTISSGTANQIETYTGTPVPSFTGYKIRAIGVYGRTKKTGSSPTQVRMALRSAGTNYFSASDIALDFGYTSPGTIWETNPATSAAFLSSEIAALEFGQKSIA